MAATGHNVMGDQFMVPLSLKLQSWNIHLSQSHTPTQELCDDALWIWTAEPVEHTCGVQDVVPSVAPGCLHSVSTPLLTEDKSSKQRHTEKQNSEPSRAKTRPTRRKKTGFVFTPFFNADFVFNHHQACRGSGDLAIGLLIGSLLIM